MLYEVITVPVLLEKEVVKQQWNVLRTLPERRDADCPRGEEVAKLFCHLPFGGGAFEVRQGGSNHPDVEFDLLGGTDGRDRLRGEEGGDVV